MKKINIFSFAAVVYKMLGIGLLFLISGIPSSTERQSRDLIYEKMVKGVSFRKYNRTSGPLLTVCRVETKIYMSIIVKMNQPALFLFALIDHISKLVHSFSDNPTVF
jgi:hypothetical protein